MSDPNGNPGDGAGGDSLSSQRLYRDRPSANVQVREIGSLGSAEGNPVDFRRVFSLSQALEGGVTEFSVASPRAIFDLGCQNWLNVDDRLGFHSHHGSFRNDRVEPCSQFSRDPDGKACAHAPDVDDIVPLASPK
jgi:hypothetical protein